MSDTDLITSTSPLLQIRLMWAFRVTVTALVGVVIWVVSGSQADLKAMKESLSELKKDVAVMQAEQRMRDLRGSK